MTCGPAELAVKLRSIFQDRSNRFSVADEIGREGSKDPHDSFRARNLLSTIVLDASFSKINEVRLSYSKSKLHVDEFLRERG